MGKGIDAAVVAAMARHTLRTAAVRAKTPSEALRRLNRVLIDDDTERYCTANFVRLRRDGDDWSLTASSAGHPLPLCVTAGGDPPVGIGEPGSMLGVVEEPSFTDTTIELGQGQTIVLYTVGVPEGRSGRDDYGEWRLEESILRHRVGGAAGLAAGLLRDALAFQAGRPRDDIAIIALSLLP